MSIDLKKLEDKLDSLFENETSDTFEAWLKQKRMEQTPKQKAEDLYNRYKPLCKDVKHVGIIHGNAVVMGDEDLNHYSAKICAIIAVDEILNISCVEIPYWLEVKYEIEKL